MSFRMWHTGNLLGLWRLIQIFTTTRRLLRAFLLQLQWSQSFHGSTGSWTWELWKLLFLQIKIFWGLEKSKGTDSSEFKIIWLTYYQYYEKSRCSAIRSQQESWERYVGLFRRPWTQSRRSQLRNSHPGVRTQIHPVSQNYFLTILELPGQTWRPLPFAPLCYTWSCTPHHSQAASRILKKSHLIAYQRL